MNHNNVPMMFRAPVENRCQLQRVIKDASRQDSHRWVDEWKQVFPESSLPQPEPPLPRKSAPGKRPRVTPKALARPTKPKPVSSPTAAPASIPDFGVGVQTRDYTVSWRLVSNSGQEEGFIRPIIGGKGFPYYSGASMKGAFLRQCSAAEGLRYCGGKLSDSDTQPGILRFHGAYPVDMNWTKRLVDIVHSQPEKQVIADETTNANAQISLYQVTFRFGISSTQALEECQWQQIWQRWEQALAQGIGGRVSAGYGQFHQVRSHPPLLQVKLKGQGVASTLIREHQQRLAEFRPNGFKAALRGHTLRLLSGLTDADTAKEFTQRLWGGFGKGNGSIVGELQVKVQVAADELELQRRDYQPNNSQASMPLYNLKWGSLDIAAMSGNLSTHQCQEFTQIGAALVKFALLLGGLGKSWRRVDHSLFYPEYLRNYKKPAIGCHWEYLEPAIDYCQTVNQLTDIGAGIDEIRQVMREWIPPEKRLPADELSPSVQQWREPWHRQTVQVWGRRARDGKSQAIHWFHRAYQGENSIKNPHRLTGSMGTTGRIWHRMYPNYVRDDSGEVKVGRGYVELLTIFPPQKCPDTDRFLRFLRQDTEFERLW